MDDVAPIAGEIPRPRRKLLLRSDVQPLIDAINGMTGTGIDAVVSTSGIRLTVTQRQGLPEGYSEIPAIIVYNGTETADVTLLIKPTIE